MKTKIQKPLEQKLQEFTFYEQLKFWDLYLSSIVHEHESLMLSVLLFPTAVIFNPQLIVIPVIFIGYNFGISIACKYIMSIVIILAISTILKRRIGRARPLIREQLTFKSMRLRRGETNLSMPSGDSMQAGGFLYYYLFSKQDEINNPVIQWVMIMTILNVMLGRVYFCCHYFTDTIVGVGLGFTINFVILYFILE